MEVPAVGESDPEAKYDEAKSSRTDERKFVEHSALFLVRNDRFIAVNLTIDLVAAFHPLQT
jgi:hypothetical protein